MLYRTENHITQAALRAPGKMLLGDIVSRYGRWKKAVHYRTMHRLTWDGLDIYVYSTEGQPVSILSSAVSTMLFRL
jgi:hypothetical protein